MLDKKSRSLSDYITSYSIFICILFFTAVIFCISFFSSILINYDIHQKMTEESDQIFEVIYEKNGKITMEESEISFKVNGIRFIVLSQNNEVLYGSYPEPYFESFKVKEGYARTAYGVNGSYYYNDTGYMIRRQSNGFIPEHITIRTFVLKQDLRSDYSSNRGLSYFCMGLLLLGTIITMIMMNRKIKKPLKELCDTAKQIIESQDLSKRMVIEDDSFSEVKIMVDANNSILDRAHEIIETQKRFSSDVAHELKTPISVIMAECQYGMKYIDSKEEAINAFRLIHEEAQKTNYIINQIFELTKLEKRQVKIQKEMIHLDDLIYTICESEPLLEEKQITVACDVGDMQILADISLMFIALRNIINNAAKYSMPATSLHIYSEKKDDKIYLYCEDHGDGIDEEDIPNIFQRFYRADQSRNSEGLGLGLSITKMIIELFDGEISVKSKKGQGSTFIIVLPLNVK